MKKLTTVLAMFVAAVFMCMCLSSCSRHPELEEKDSSFFTIAVINSYSFQDLKKLSETFDCKTDEDCVVKEVIMYLCDFNPYLDYTIYDIDYSQIDPERLARKLSDLSERFVEFTPEVQYVFFSPIYERNHMEIIISVVE